MEKESGEEGEVETGRDGGEGEGETLNPSGDTTTPSDSAVDGRQPPTTSGAGSNEEAEEPTCTAFNT